MPAGQILAVCGPTGSGKSTLLNLLPRYYDPTEGRLLVGGVESATCAWPTSATPSR